MLSFKNCQKDVTQLVTHRCSKMKAKFLSLSGSVAQGGDKGQMSGLMRCEIHPYTFFSPLPNPQSRQTFRASHLPVSFTTVPEHFLSTLSSSARANAFDPWGVFPGAHYQCGLKGPGLSLSNSLGIRQECAGAGTSVKPSGKLTPQAMGSFSLLCLL